MKARTGLLIGALLVILLSGILQWMRPRSKKEPATSNRQVSVASVLTNKTPTLAAKTNLIEVPPGLIAELNRFIALARPYGLEGPITPVDITYVTNHPKNEVIFETKTHLAEFFGTRLHHFLAMHDMSNPVADPETKKEAMNKWYQATAPWTEKEALEETHRILERLGIRASWEKQESRPFTITVRNPQGEAVQVTPFYSVTLEGPKGTIMAEFRMGQSGRGRLTEWFNHTRPDAQEP